MSLKIVGRGRIRLCATVLESLALIDNAATRSVAYADRVNDAIQLRFPVGELLLDPPEVDVVIEVPKGSFLKRGSTGHIDFIAPLPCPFNYGSVPKYLGPEDDLLDAVVLGRRLPLGASLRVKAWGAVVLVDRGMTDDKLVCSETSIGFRERERVLRFFAFYARCEWLLNVVRHQPGRNACDGWLEASRALGRARLRDSTWRGPSVTF